MRTNGGRRLFEEGKDKKTKAEAEPEHSFFTIPPTWQRIWKDIGYDTSRLQDVFTAAGIHTLSPVPTRKKPYLRSIVQSLYPKLPANERANLAGYLSNFLGETLGAIDVDQPDLKQRNNLQDVLYSHKGTIDELVRAYQATNPTAPSDSREVAGKQTLRSRFYLPGDEDFVESPYQQVSDAVSGDLFSLPGAVPEVGINNSLFLDQRLNEMRNESNAIQPRPNIAQLVESYPVPWQWGSFELPVDDIVQDMFYDRMVAAVLPVVIPGNVSLSVDTRLEPAMPVPGAFETAIYNPLSPQPEVSNRLGFKSSYSSWRYPLQRDEPSGAAKAAFSRDHPELLLMGANYPNYLFS